MAGNIEFDWKVTPEFWILFSCGMIELILSLVVLYRIIGCKCNFAYLMIAFSLLHAINDLIWYFANAILIEVVWSTGQSGFAVSYHVKMTNFYL